MSAARNKNTCLAMEGSPNHARGTSRSKGREGCTPGTTSTGESSQGTPDTPTPTRKNKRKMSAPRKRSDVVPVKRINLEDGTADLYEDCDDMGVKELNTSSPVTPDTPNSDRNNSTGSGSSPAHIVLPQQVRQQVPDQFLTGMTGLYPAPLLTTVGGIPQYIIPGMPTGFMPHPAMLQSGLPGIALPPGLPPGVQLTYKSPNMDKNHNCLRQPEPKESSPSGSQCSGSAPSPSPSFSSTIDPDESPSDGSKRNRKNYKNMTRERRVEANARERTRVHTISASFDSLRKAVPSYSYHQRLSKLAILRIACSYILALSRLADMDYSEEQDGLSFSDCVDLCTQTIQSEGRAKRRH